MKRRYHYNAHTWLAAATALLLTACTGDDATTQTEEQEAPISFTVEAVRTIDMTRGQMLRTADDLGDIISVTAFQTIENAAVSGAPNFFYNEQATRQTGTNTYRLSQDYEWPRNGDEKGTVLTFFAYVPVSPYVELSADDYEGVPTLTYTVPTAEADQVDLMTCQTNGSRFKSNVALTMEHRLCAVRFVIGENFAPGTIRSITLRNVYGKGVYTFGQTAWDFTGQTPIDFTLTLNKAVEGNNEEALMVTDDAFLMIPQTLSASAALEVVFIAEDGTEINMSQSISGTWEAGKVVTYGISSEQLKGEYGNS